MQHKKNRNPACSGFLFILSLTNGPDIVKDVYDSFSKGSSKNERKINPIVQQGAENRVKGLEIKLKNAKTNSERNEIKRQIQHWRGKATEKSEPHGRGSGRH